MRKPKLYAVEIPADLRAVALANDTIIDQAHRYVTTRANFLRRVRIDETFFCQMATALLVTKHQAVDLVQILLLSGLLREIGEIPQYVVDDFIDDSESPGVAS